jgi:hypothetical protein
VSKIVPLQASVHRQVDRLLPWLVNGSLEGDELDDVQRHLGTCVRCRQETRDLQRQQALYAGFDPAPPSPADFERLRQRLPRGAATGLGPRWRAWRARVADAWRPSRPALRWTLAAQALLVAALALAPWREAPAPDAPYRTLGAPVAAGVAAAQLVVVFDPGLSERRMRALLHASDARIVGGPSEAGAYLLALPAPRVAAAQAALRRADGVVLVERLQAPPAP